MTEFKGRHFGVLLMMCCTWAAARVSINLWSSGEVGSGSISSQKRNSPNPATPTQNTPAAIITETHDLCCTPVVANKSSPRQIAPLFATATAPLTNVPIDDQILLQQQDFRTAAPMQRPEMHHPDRPSRSLPASTPRVFSVNAYAYSFWRWDAKGTGLAPAGQYGGGQSGLIATIGLANGAATGASILARASMAHDNLHDRELALGIRWQPKATWPVSISAERRFRGLGADNFALYVAGGQDNIALPAKFKLETFAQAGLVSGSNAGHFFDAQARADRPLELASRVPVHLGAGVWTGGQRGISRLDIGPSLRTEIPVGQTRLRLTADWRFRIAGDAAPGNGPALTLSTGF